MRGGKKAAVQLGLKASNRLQKFYIFLIYFNCNKIFILKNRFKTIH